jgi:hypothetical protein
MIFGFVIANNFYFYPGNLISYDVFGYYLYLPLTFLVDGDSQEALNYLQEIQTKYSSSDTLYQIQTLPDGDFVLKYTSGWAVCYAPFFFLAHLVTYFTDYPSDGLSEPYQVGVFLGSLFYTLVGVYFLHKITRHFFSKKLALLLVILVLFGTNYLFHNTMYGQGAMTHNLLFTAYTIIVWLTIQWYNNQRLKTIIALGLVCGLVILTRPTEVVCLFIPLLWPLRSPESRISFLKKYKKQLIVFTSVIVAIGSIQLIYWKIKTGHLLFFDYGNPAEGLDFLAPHTLDTLFSFRKGWYIYTPLMLLATFGFITLYKKDKKLFIPLFTFFILNLYLVSSWSCWWYASSFSQRALIPSMVIMIIPLGYLLRYLWIKKSVVKLLTALLLILIVSLNIFQTIQFSRGVLPGDRITKEYYLATFGSLTPNPTLKKEFLLIDRHNAGEVNYQDTSKYRKYVLHENSFENEPGHTSEISFSGQHAFKLSADTIYTPPFKKAYKDITTKEHAFIRITAMVYKMHQEENQPSFLTASFDYKNATYKWNSVPLMPIPAREWTEVEQIYLTPETRTLNDRLTVQFWHRHNHNIYVDDLKIEVFEPK